MQVLLAALPALEGSQPRSDDWQLHLTKLLTQQQLIYLCTVHAVANASLDCDV